MSKDSAMNAYFFTLTLPDGSVHMRWVFSGVLEHALQGAVQLYFKDFGLPSQEIRHIATVKALEIVDSARRAIALDTLNPWQTVPIPVTHVRMDQYRAAVAAGIHFVPNEKDRAELIRISETVSLIA